MFDHQIKTGLADYFSVDSSEVWLQSVSGGDTHQNFQASITGKDYFVKANGLANQQVLLTEFKSLQTINNLFADSYPQAIDVITLEQSVLLLMEYRAISSVTESAAYQAGRLLAQQHQITFEQFGWDEANFIGSTPQTNQWQQSWPDFFAQSRLQPQLDLAIKQGLPKHCVERVEQMIVSLPTVLNHQPKASLVHGDLWSGNIGVADGEPILFDPAPYFGDAEVDLAMTELFGGFPDSFYSGYQTILPIQQGYQRRKNIYNLYHALNHFNLFGSGYIVMVDRLSEL